MQYDDDDIGMLNASVDAFMIALKIDADRGGGGPGQESVKAILNILDRLKALGHRHPGDFLLRMSVKAEVRVEDMDATSAKCLLLIFQEFMSRISSGEYNKSVRKNLRMVEQVHHALTHFPPEDENFKNDIQVCFNEIVQAMFEDCRTAELGWRMSGKKTPPPNIMENLPRFMALLDIADKIPLIDRINVAAVRASFEEILGVRDNFLENRVANVRSIDLSAIHSPDKKLKEVYPEMEYNPEHSLNLLIAEAKKLSAEMVEDGHPVAFAMMVSTLNPDTGESSPPPGSHIFITSEAAFNSKDDVNGFMNNLKQVSVKTNAIAYVLCVEAWSAAMPKGEKPNANFQPSKQANRKEVVLIQGQRIGQSPIAFMAEIQNKKLGEFEVSTKVDSRFSDILDPTN